ncbi:glycosyltransferase [Agromyces luteolus]|uniref:Glycosyltransferase n=1 Tax=Agromyces luteolus TaxID=88373 RepID=A0A7C9LDH8_9MICO|nr:glycosyltransferase family 2 protein [Agromyces luteolus]MUN07031.1 glycosyltransferase [Agromyces luteolus]GLK28361.1 glycosyltransferase [Agromyces luteolus]
MTRAHVTTIVVAYNSSSVLPDLLGSLGKASTGDVDLDVLVVDNDSRDREASRRIAEADGARFLALDRNVGYGGGVNAGAGTVAESDGYLLVCNADLRFEQGSIDELVRFAEAHPEVGALGPAILNEDGTVYPSARRSPTLREGIGHALLGGIAPRNPWSRRYREESVRTDRPRPAGWLSGACLLVRADLFHRLGGFDESYFMYFEDVDLGDRVRAAGHENMYVPAAKVTHLGAHSTSEVSSRMLAVHHDSAYRYLSRRYPAWWQAPIRWALRAGLWIRLRWITRRARPIAAGAGRTAHS